MVGPSLEGHAIVPLVLGGRHELVEGAATEGLFLLEFPSYGEAVAWYQSPAYLTVEPGNAAAESMDNVSRRILRLANQQKFLQTYPPLQPLNSTLAVSRVKMLRLARVKP
jgi:uncharacterized protein (DUF1330 family)